VPEPRSATQSPSRVLLVDDDPDLRMLLASVLEREGFDVVEAGDGEEALAIFDARGEEVDLIVTDIWMPRCSGLAMLEALRGRGVDVPVVVVSAHVDGETKARAQSLRAAAFLAQPFRTSDVRRVVTRVAYAAEAPRAPAAGIAAP
jgi:two-component system response regulator AtoC